MYVVVVGCGKLGAIVASMLSRAGENVVVIDRDEEAFARLAPDFSGWKLEEDGTEVKALERAHIRDADVVVACTEDDNTNVMVAQMARHIYGVPQVIARLFDPAREGVYKELGIETISPTLLSAQRFREVIRP